jgi:hypothetical protein
MNLVHREMSIITGGKTTFKIVSKLQRQYRHFYWFRDKCPWKWTFCCKYRHLTVKCMFINTEMQFYRDMTVKHLFIIQATGLGYGRGVWGCLTLTFSCHIHIAFQHIQLWLSTIVWPENGILFSSAIKKSNI